MFFGFFILALELSLGRFHEVENEDASFQGADAGRDAFSENEELPVFMSYGVSGFHNALSLDDEEDDSIEDCFRKVFSESTNVDVFSDMREYAGETNCETCDDFLSVRELGEMDNLPGSRSGSAYTGDVVVSGHGGFLSGGEKGLPLLSDILCFQSSVLISLSETR